MSRNKKCKNFKQYKEPWASVKYPRYPYYVSDSGCGPTACADIIVTNPKYKKITPKDTANWLRNHGHATYGNGTTWAGIKACLKHYGFKVTQHDDMASFWKEMKKPGRLAVISFRGGTKGGVTWTLGGHFLACSGMEIKNKKHRLYMLDPGPRANNGWHTYEDHMRGLVAQLWVCYLPETKKTTTKKESTKKTTTKKTTTKKTTTKKTTNTTHKVKYKVVTRSGMNVRDTYSTKGERINGVGYGQTFTSSKKHGNWVYAPSLKGWVCIKDNNETYLKKV